MEDKAKFWSNPQSWPKDRSGEFVFLAEAVSRLGPLVCGPSWSMGDAYAEPLLLLTKRGEHDGKPYIGPYNFPLKPWQEVLLHNLLRTHRPDFGRGPIKHGSYGREKLQFTAEEKRTGYDIAQTIDDARSAQHDRMSAVIEFVATSVVRGKLEWAIKAGGRFAPMNSTASWNGDPIGQRFHWGLIDPANPFGPGIGGKNYVPIFFTAESLEVTLASLKPALQRTPTKNVSTDQIDEQLIRIFADVEAGTLEKTNREAVVQLVREHLPYAQVDRIKRRFAAKRPNWWKSGQ